ncbi:MAG: response regulator [Roseiflexaceae bacterium]
MARILVIEYDPDVRTLLLMLLQRAGHSVRGVPSGMRGLELMADIQPDLVLVSLELPVMNGWSVLRQARADHQLRRVPLIAMTTQPTPAYRIQAILAGFQDVITKPFQIDTLLQSVTVLAPPQEPPPFVPSCILTC